MGEYDEFNRIVEGVELAPPPSPATLDDLLAIQEEVKLLPRLPEVIEFVCAVGEFERTRAWLRKVFSDNRPDDDEAYSPPELGGQLSVTLPDFAAVPFVINENGFVPPNWVILRVNGEFQQRVRMT